MRMIRRRWEEFKTVLYMFAVAVSSFVIPVVVVIGVIGLVIWIVWVLLGV